VSWVKTILGGVIAAGYTPGSQIVCTRHLLLVLLHERLTIQSSFNSWTPLIQIGTVFNEEVGCIRLIPTIEFCITD
jgi:hypothetical protein